MAAELSEFHQFAEDVFDSVMSVAVYFLVESGHLVGPLFWLFAFLDDYLDFVYDVFRELIIGLLFLLCEFNYFMDPFEVFQFEEGFAKFVESVFFSSHHDILEGLFDENEEFVGLDEALVGVFINEAVLSIVEEVEV